MKYLNKIEQLNTDSLVMENIRELKYRLFDEIINTNPNQQELDRYQSVLAKLDTVLNSIDKKIYWNSNEI